MKKRTSAEIHSMIAEKVIEAMEISGTNWVKSWATPTGQLPTSMSTGKHYQGINLLILGMTRAANNYGSHHWATYRQWESMGAQVQKGEKATAVILYKPIKIRNKETGEPETIPLLKAFSIFNADQVDGYEAPAIVDDIDHTKLEQPDTLADQLASRAGCDVRFSDPDRAFYSPAHDFVNMPRATQFGTVEDYAATLLHELTHWTGHSARMDRDLTLMSNGSKDYAKEELVAELGAAMMCGSLGITAAPREDHAKYLAVWMQRLKDEPKVIFSAAAKANQAAEWIFSAAKVQASEVSQAA
jgi:antirestriction protein ArdC